MLRTIPQPHVVKRDGREEPFNIDKLIASVAAALADAGEEMLYARPVCEAVAWCVRQDGSASVRSDDLAYLVRQALEQVGMTRSSLLFAQEAARRAEGREHLRVVCERRGARYTQPWSRRRWVRDILRRGVSANAARSLVSRVERRLLQLGLNPVTEVLVRELLACERRAGFAQAELSA
jgi:transcriptional regulator NrdR family protein